MKTLIKLYGAPSIDAEYYTEVEKIDESKLTPYNGEFYKYGAYLYVNKLDVANKPTKTTKGRKKNDT